MGRMYSAVFQGVAVTAAQDFFEFATPATGMLALHSVVLAQSTDVGDAAEEILRVEIARFTGAPTSGSGGTTPTPAPLEGGAAASGVTTEVNNTTEISGGTKEILHADAFNIRSGWLYHPTPEERLWLGPSDHMVVTLLAAPADSLTMEGTAIYEEFGS